MQSSLGVCVYLGILSALEQALAILPPKEC